MAVITQDEAGTGQPGSDRFVFLALVLGGVITVIHKEIDARNGLQRLDRIAVEDPANAVVRLGQQESGVRIDVGSEVLPRESFCLVPHQGSAKQYRSQSFIDSCLDHDAGLQYADKSIPTNSPAEDASLIGSASLWAFPDALDDVPLNLFVLLNLAKVAGRHGVRYWCQHRDWLRALVL